MATAPVAHAVAHDRHRGALVSRPDLTGPWSRSVRLVFWRPRPRLDRDDPELARCAQDKGASGHAKGRAQTLWQI